MKLRRLKKKVQELHGYWNTRSSREPTGGPDPFTGETGPRRSIRFYISDQQRWRPLRLGAL